MANDFHNLCAVNRVLAGQALNHRSVPFRLRRRVAPDRASSPSDVLADLATAQDDVLEALEVAHQTLVAIDVWD